jgi:hypothetical protein
VQEAEEPADDRTVGGDTVPMSPSPAPAASPPASTEHWLLPARLFAMDLLTHMLGRPGSPMHDRLQAIHSAPRMMAWIEECTLYLAAAAGAERAGRFQSQVMAFVPPALRGAAAQTPRPLTLADLVPGRMSSSRPVWTDGPRWTDPPARSMRGKQPPQPTTGPGALLEED